MRGGPWLAFLALTCLPGCNVVALGALALPASTEARPLRASTFSLAPTGSVSLVSPLAEAPPVMSAGEEGKSGAVAEAPPGALAAAEHLVRVVGRARVFEGAVGIANVHQGYVTGTPIIITEARTGRRLAAGVTFYDGSFALDVRFRASELAVVVGTELFAEGEDLADAERTALSSPAMLRASQAEHHVAVTPGSTALTAFLQALAGLAAASDTSQPAAGSDTPQPAEPPAFSSPVGPRFGSLVAGIDEEERDGFARLAEASSELRDAGDLAAIRDGITRFVSRLTPPPR